MQISFLFCISVYFYYLKPEDCMCMGISFALPTLWFLTYKICHDACRNFRIKHLEEIGKFSYQISLVSMWAIVQWDIVQWAIVLVGYCPSGLLSVPQVVQSKLVNT